MTKSYIWPLASRISHIVMIISFALAWFCSEFDGLLYWHSVFGAIFGLAIVFRIIWGIIGSKYSRFVDFDFKNLKEYFLSFLSEKKHYIGHNPASSFAIVFMLFFGLLCVISGFVLYGVSENAGIFANLYTNYRHWHFVEDLHEMLFYILLFVVVIHTCGALIDKFLYKHDGIDSMLSGYKKTEQTKSIKLNSFQKIFSIVWILALLAFLIYAFNPNNAILGSKFKPINYKAQNENFVKECASCHMLYAPFLLPTNSWQTMMSDLENHFGDDASIDDELNIEISNFLFANSAQNVNIKAAQKIYQADENGENIAIAKNKYWIKRHSKISQEVFAHKLIKSKANCVACHENIDKGEIGKLLIKYDILKLI